MRKISVSIHIVRCFFLSQFKNSVYLMDIKKVLKGRRKLTAKRTRAKRNTKDTDSGISSASSCDTADAIELPPCIISDIKVEDVAEGKCYAFSPVVLLERSEEAERQLRQKEHVNLYSLELHVHSDDQPIKTHSVDNKTGKDLMYSENFREPNKAHIIDAEPPTDSSSTKVFTKYNLRNSDKCSVPRRFRDTPPPVNKSITDIVNFDLPPIKTEPILHNIKIVKDLSGEKEKEPILHNIKIIRDLSGDKEKSSISLIPLDLLVEPARNLKRKRGRRKRVKTRLHSMKTKRSKGSKHHRKFWKRSNDVPSDLDCITSDHTIFEGAVLGKFSCKQSKKIKIESDFKTEASIRETPERTTSESVSMETPEKKDVDGLTSPTTTLTPPQIKITFSTSLNDRKVKKINFTSPSPELKTESEHGQGELELDVSKSNNNVDVSCNNTVNSCSSDGENELPEPHTYAFNKFGSRLKRFNAVTKLRENVDKPVNNCKSRKRNTLSENELSPKKAKTVDEIVNTNAMKEIDYDISSPKMLFNTPPIRNQENILDKSGSETSNDGTSRILEKSPPVQNVTPSPKGSLNVTPPAIPSKDTTSEALEKCSPQKPSPVRKLFIKSPECVKNNFLNNPIQLRNNNNNSEVNCGTPTKAKFDLRQRLNKQRNIFKTPLLPLIKRPPTRITPEVLSKLDQTATRRYHSNQDFDAISLYAESFCEGDNKRNLNEPCPVNDEDQFPEADMVLYPEEEKERKESATPDFPTVEVPVADGKCNGSREKSVSLEIPTVELPVVTSKYNRSTTGSQTAKPQKLYSDHTKLTENCKPVMQSVQESNFSPSSENTSVDKDTLKVSEWIASASNETQIIPDMKLDVTLKKFCHHFCKHGRCNYYKFNGKYCRFMHKTPDFFKSMIMDLSPHQFKRMYSYILQKLSHLFTEVFHILVNYLKDQEKALIDMVKDVIHVTHLEKKPYVIMILSALENLGLSFNLAVEEIFIAHNKEQWLVEILFDIVVNDQNCLKNNWSLVQKLINYLQHNVDHGIVSDIFNKCIETYPTNKEFCKNVYIDLIQTDRLNLSHEPESKINKYVNLLRSFGLSEYVNHLQKKINVHSNEEPVNIIEQCDVVDEEEAVNSTDIKEPTFSGSSSNMSLEHSDLDYEPMNAKAKEQTNAYMNLLKETNVNSIRNNSSFDTYIPVVQEQNVTEYVPTQPFTAFNSHNQSYRRESLVQQDVEEAELYNPENANNYLTGTAKCVPKRIPSIKDDGLVAFHPWASNKSSTSTDTESQSTLNDVSNKDIMELCKALKQKNIPMILSLFAKYSLTNLSKSFVIHVITALKNLEDPNHVESLVKEIFWGFESLGATSLALNQTHLLQLFGFNILTYLDRYRKYEVAHIILKKFPNYSDFITVEGFYYFENLSTTNFRYLFIFKVLTRNGKFRDALMFLKSLDLKLNDSVFSDENPPVYLEYKKRLISEFIDETLNKNIPVAKDMLCFLILEVRSCQCIDFETYLNHLIINMLNNYNEYKLELTDIFQIIISSWYKYLRTDVLRALFVQMYNELSDLKILELYRINVRSKVYEAPEGIANSITILSNLLKEEIYILLHLYFHNLSKNNYPVKNIIIDIKPALEEEPEDTSISVLTNSRTNSGVMKTRILNVLNKFPNSPGDRYSESEHCIMLAFEDMRGLLEYYRTENLPPLLKFR